MVDRQKVIKGLVCCCSPTTYDCTNRCPYTSLYEPGNGYKNCMAALLPDALALIKEQEPVKPVVNVDEWVCGCCGLSVEQQRIFHPNAIFHDFFEYCPHCGKKVDWEAVNQNDQP